MAVKTKSIENIFSIKELSKKFLNSFIPKILIKKLMIENFTTLGFEISNACNANCSFCAYRFMTRRRSIIKDELVYKVVKEYNNNGGGTISFTPVVGDPLVDKNLLEKIKHCKKTNIEEIFLYTNGLFLNKFNTEKLLRSGLTRIAISTYLGNENGYKKYYGSNKYKLMIKNVTNLIKKNYHLGNIVNITLHLRVDLPEENWNKSSDFLNISKYLPSKNITWLTKYENWSGKISKKDIPKGCVIEEKSFDENKFKSPCFEMYRRIHILADGEVGVCSCRDIDAEINIGNIKENSLKDLWKGRTLKKYREDWLNKKIPDICKNCDRYEPVDDYIKRNSLEILRMHIKKFFNQKKIKI